MKNYEQCEVIKEERVVKKIICNNCEVELWDADALRGGDYYLSFSFGCGYGRWFDSEAYEFDLCAECYLGIVSNFNLPIVSTDHHS